MKILYYILFLGIIFPAWVQAQWMEETQRNKIGVKVGIGANWLQNHELALSGKSEKYTSVPRQGLIIGVYSRSRLTKFCQAFNYRSNVRNWYFQYEINAAYRGGNFRYKIGKPDGTGGYSEYISSDTGRFKKISTFVLEAPAMIVWDYKDKQKFNLMAGISVSYVVRTELYKANDPSPLYFNYENYDQLVQWKNWGWSTQAGFQIMGEYVGFKCLYRYGLTSINKNLAMQLDGSGNITRKIPGNLNPMAIDFYLVF